jgi:dUTPase
MLDRAIGKCPTATVKIGETDIELKSLLDSGAQVSTITESFFQEHLQGKYDLVDTSAFISITAANGWSVPYIGYIELDISILGEIYPSLGFLVVKDTAASQFAARKREVPGVIGSNILQQVSKRLSSTRGRTKGPRDEAGDTWRQVLDLYNHEVSNVSQPECLNDNGHMGFVRVASSEPVLIPAGTARKVEALAPQTLSNRSYNALVERIATEDRALPRGLRVASTVSSVHRGRTHVQVANFSEEDAYLPKKAILGQLVLGEVIPHDECEVQEVSINEVQVGGPRIHKSEELGADQDHYAIGKGLVSSMDIGSELSPDETRRLTTLIGKYSSVFSKGDHDLGYCDKIKHRIMTTDDIPVKVLHRRIPPHQWEAVREYISTQSKTGVIRKSTSPYASAVVLVKKPDGTIRVCGDWRGLNTKTIKDAYPLPRINEALESLNGAKYFSSIDLAHGFLQCAIDERDMHKTAIRVGSAGLWEYTRII